jgi:uncharacterized membrane protein
MQRWTRIARPLAVAIGLYYVVFGIWAFLAPDSFYTGIASFAPFNVHLLHDAGAFQTGLGLALILVVVLPDALAAVALAVGTASLLHVVSHVIDLGRGGQPARDLTALAIITALLGVVLGLRAWSTRAPGRRAESVDPTDRAIP